MAVEINVPLQDVRKGMQVEGIAGSIKEERNVQSKVVKVHNKTGDFVNCMAEGVDVGYKDVRKRIKVEGSAVSMAEERNAQYKGVAREPRGGAYVTDTEDYDIVRLRVVIEKIEGEVFVHGTRRRKVCSQN